MCLMYSIMVLILLLLIKCWFTDKSLVLHYFVYITDITWGIDINSFKPYTRHTGPPIWFRNDTFSGSIPKLIYYTIIQQKSEYNVWHRWYIEILTSYSDSTSQISLENVPYVICRCGLIPSDFGDFYKTCYHRDFK